MRESVSEVFENNFFFSLEIIPYVRIYTTIHVSASNASFVLESEQ